MRHLDLFSGIGGFALAASWVWGSEHEIVGFCEIDSFCQKVLKKHWPDAPIYSDIKELKGDQFNAIELITGGFPCQPYSVAGKQQGKEDDRHLWPEMFRIIRETRPRWIIAENVSGIVNMELDTVLFDLESQGYTTETFIIPACAVDAPHRRDRVWILGYPEHLRRNAAKIGKSIETRKRSFEGGKKKIGEFERPGVLAHSKVLADSTGARQQTCGGNGMENEPTGEIWKTAACSGSDVPYADKKRLSAQRESGWLQETQGKTCSGIERGSLLGEEWNWARWEPEPELGRVANGIPDRVDRLKSLGNAIVPQVAAVIMQGIKLADSAK